MDKKFMKSGIIILIVAFIVVSMNVGAETGDNQVSQVELSSQQQAFINEVLPAAQDGLRDGKLLASVTLAQAILESNWGESGLSKNSNNLFGIKGAYNGKSVSMRTMEATGATTANFRVYPSWQESIKDHTDLITHNARYKDAVGETDYRKALQAIKDGGYATDPEYVNKLATIIERYNLTQYDIVYDKIESHNKIAAIGKVAPNKTQEIIWTTPYNTAKSEKIDTLANYENHNLEVSWEAKTKKGHWYFIRENNKDIGWINSNALTLSYHQQEEENVNLTKYVDDLNGHIYRLPSPEKQFDKGTIASYDRKALHANKKITRDGYAWLKLSVGNTEIGWVRADKLNDRLYDRITEQSVYNGYAKIKTPATENVWTNPYNTKNAEKVAPLSDYATDKLELVTRAKVGNMLWYQFKVDGQLVGWTSEKDLSIIYTPESEKPITQVAYVKTPEAIVYSKPVETTNTKLKEVGYYYGKLLLVDKEATILSEKWLHLKDNDSSIGWIKATDLQS
ncbi:GW domain-containing glycosaminoglycan-binding protein [Listeria ivanovii subsp. londoniensis]|uniref:GW domain-containing glycosaminoglycan-binding protein n=1 Tax=Listeria ivanovii TaxID=1638 RepID=UPI001904BCCB|nr:GW domain-containing glycosaminoglycan-binding protein [Listeria ivanovii]MBK2003579.1 GW domain-containing glycosaminoglycan-binding protein [Listeria ivanovii subsp. londoniensis]